MILSCYTQVGCICLLTCGSTYTSCACSLSYCWCIYVSLDPCWPISGFTEFCVVQLVAEFTRYQAEVFGRMLNISLDTMEHVRNRAYRGPEQALQYFQQWKMGISTSDDEALPILESAWVEAFDAVEPAVEPAEELPWLNRSRQSMRSMYSVVSGLFAHSVNHRASPQPTAGQFLGMFIYSSFH